MEIKITKYMMNYIACLTVFAISLLLSKVDIIGVREARILTILGWLIALYFANVKGGVE